MMMKLNVLDIQAYLRNRPPFLMIDRAEVVPGKSAKAYKNVTINEPHFAGHFPGNPLMPGALQLEAMFNTAALAIHTMPGNKEKTSVISRVENAAFYETVRPGDCLEITAELNSYKRGVGKAAAAIYCGQVLVAEATLVISLPEDIPAIRKGCVENGGDQ